MYEYFDRDIDSGEYLLNEHGEKALEQIARSLSRMSNAQLLDEAKHLSPGGIVISDLTAQFGFESEDEFIATFALGTGDQKELLNMREAMIEKCYDLTAYAMDLEVNDMRSYLWGVL